MPAALTTTDHDTIRRWTEERGGRPARVAGTVDEGGGGLLRIEFDPSRERLEEIDWKTFFDAFEKNRLAFLYQEETDEGEPSRFFKLVDRDGAD